MAAEHRRVSPLRPFRHRGYATVWTGAFVSNVGTWMETVAVGVYVTQTTGRAAWTGTVAALAFVPTVVVGPIGGALADRVDRRRFLAAITLGQTALAGTLALLALTSRLSLPWIAAIMLLAGCCTAAQVPAWSSMLPDLVPAEDLLGAVSLSSAQFNLGRVVGPAFAGLAIAAGGVSLAFGLNTMSFGAVLVALALIRLPAVRRDVVHPPLLEGIRAGVRAARGDAGIRTALTLMLVTAFLVSPFISLVPAVAIKVFGRGAGATAALVTAQGLGAVASALAAGPLAARFGRRRVLVAAYLALGPAAVLYALAPTFPLAVVALFCLGAVYLSVLSGTSTVCQIRAPRELRGRVLSLFMLVLGTGYPLGSVVQGWAGDQLGLRLVTAVTGMALLAVVLAVRLLRPALLQALEGSQPAGQEPAVAALAPEPPEAGVAPEPALGGPS